MKVFHAAETIKGGVAAVMRQLITNQLSSRHEIYCLIPDDQAQELDVLSERFLRYFRRSGRNIGSLSRFTCLFIKNIWYLKPDIVHLHSTFSGLIGRLCIFFLWPFRRPRVVYCPHAFSFLMNISPVRRWLYTWIERSLQPLADAIICVSNFEYDEAVSLGLNKDKLHVIYNGVPVAERSATAADKDRDEACIRALFVGRLDYQKGFDVLLEAIDLVRVEKIHLFVAGGAVNDDGDAEVLKENVTYYGWITADELKSIYSMSDVLVAPSRWEGFPVAPLEAMSFGLPVIASNNCSYPEMIENGVNGFLVETENAEQIADLLSSVPVEEWRRLGKQAQALVRNRFSTAAMVNQTEKLYSMCIGKK